MHRTRGKYTQFRKKSPPSLTFAKTHLLNSPKFGYTLNPPRRLFWGRKRRNIRRMKTRSNTNLRNTSLTGVSVSQTEAHSCSFLPSPTSKFEVADDAKGVEGLNGTVQGRRVSKGGQGGVSAKGLSRVRSHVDYDTARVFVNVCTNKTITARMRSHPPTQIQWGEGCSIQKRATLRSALIFVGLRKGFRSHFQHTRGLKSAIIKREAENFWKFFS